MTHPAPQRLHHLARSGDQDARAMLARAAHRQGHLRPPPPGWRDPGTHHAHDPPLWFDDWGNGAPTYGHCPADEPCGDGWGCGEDNAEGEGWGHGQTQTNARAGDLGDGGLWP